MKKEKHTLLRKLHLERDLSVNREIFNGGRIRRATAMFAGRMKDLLTINIFVLITLVPAAVLLFYLLPLWETEATKDLSFTGNLGMGYPGALEDVTIGALRVYDLRILTLAYLVPCFTLFGVGMAGAFYCMRNYAWGTPVEKFRHFFRGIKKYGITFAIAFSLFGGIAFIVGFSILRHLKLDLINAANVGSYFFMVFMCILAVLYLAFLMFFLPHVVCYKVKWRYHFKNALVLSTSLFPIAFLNIVFMSVPLLLILIPSVGLVLFYFLAVVALWGVYSLWSISIGQYAFDNFIERAIEAKDVEQVRLHAAEKNKQKKQRETTAGKNAGRVSYKKKKK